MNVIVDTPIWSLALRRRHPPSPQAEEVATLLREDRAILLGVVRQEVLSGIPDPEDSRCLRETLRSCPDYPLDLAHYEVAAESYNICRANGVQGSHIDFLICAVAQLDRRTIFTTDRDFQRYARHLPITLL